MTLNVLEASDDDLVVELPSLAATAELASVFASLLKRGVSLGLSGELGAGKTEFVRQLVGAMRHVPAAECRDVVSPSFMLEAVYPLPTGGPLAAIHHWDLYRIAGGDLPGELDEIMADPSLLKLIEWHERVPSLARLLSLELVIAFSGLLPGENSQKSLSFTAGEEPIGEGRTCRIRGGAGMRSQASGADLWKEVRAALLKESRSLEN